MFRWCALLLGAELALGFSPERGIFFGAATRPLFQKSGPCAERDTGDVSGEEGRGPELQVLMRNLLTAATALHLLGAGAVPTAGAATLEDVIFPSSVSRILSSTEPFYVIKDPSANIVAGDATGTGYSVNLPSSLDNWRQFSIQLPSSKMGVSAFPTSAEGETRFTEGFLSRWLQGELPVLDGSLPKLDITSLDSLRALLRSGVTGVLNMNDLTPVASIFAIVVLANAIQYADQLAKTLDDERNESLVLKEKYESTKKTADTVSVLRSDAIEMSAQVEDLKSKLQASLLKEKYSQTAVDDAMKQLQASLLKEKHSQTAVDDAMKQLSAVKSEADSLRATADSLRAAVAAASSSVSTASAERVAFAQAREKKFVEAVKSFMVEQGFMSPAVAQMLLSSSATEIIEQASKRKVVSKREKELETEVATLRAQAASKMGEAEIDRLKDELRAAAKYIKEQTVEVDDLKQKLLHSEDRFMDEQRQMQSKVDSAKAVAKELNARLETKGAFRHVMAVSPVLRQLCTLTTSLFIYPPQAAPRASAVEVLKVIAPVVAKTSANAGRLNVLKEMSANQRKRMTKLELETELKKLGIKKNPSDGGALGDMLKVELLDLVESMLEGV